jgi:hypothetical protein
MSAMPAKAPAGIAAYAVSDSSEPAQSSVPDADASSSQMSAPGNASLQVLKAGKRRGRRPNQERRDAVCTAIRTHGGQWRDHLNDIFTDLDRQEVPLGGFQSVKIDLGEGESAPVSTWADLDLADGEQRRQIVDALRKYTD